MSSSTFTSRWLDWEPENSPKRPRDAGAKSAERASRTFRTSLEPAFSRIFGSLRAVPFASLCSRFDAVATWLEEHRPDLIAALADWQGNPDPIERGRNIILEGLKAAAAAGCHVEPVPEGSEQVLDARAARIWSRVLDAELWIAADEEAADELQREGVTLPVLLPSEAMILGRMAAADAREVFATLARVQRVMPGSRLRSVHNLDA